MVNDAAREPLVIEALCIAVRARRPDPLLAPTSHTLLCGFQLRVRQSHRQTGQIERLTQRRFAALRIEQLLDITEICGKHPRARRRGRAAVTTRGPRRVRNGWCAPASLFGSFVLHESNPLILLAASAAGHCAPRQLARRTMKSGRRIRWRRCDRRILDPY